MKNRTNWFACADHPTLSDFMVPKVFPNTLMNINAPLGFGKIQKAGKVEIAALIEDFRNKLYAEGLLLKEEFHYTEVIENGNCIFYNDVEAKHLIFCEGYGLEEESLFQFSASSGFEG
ncbi:MAG: hypothetical protein U5K51_07550 [Flavobacteriaceae bacterium]|nr:hypothetical protein [Flavobacteriaceae bacterium]